jgi:hypothetical protein
MPLASISQPAAAAFACCFFIASCLLGLASIASERARIGAKVVGWPLLCWERWWPQLSSCPVPRTCMTPLACELPARCSYNSSTFLPLLLNERLNIGYLGWLLPGLICCYLLDLVTWIFRVKLLLAWTGGGRWHRPRFSRMCNQIRGQEETAVAVYRKYLHSTTRTRLARVSPRLTCHIYISKYPYVM